MLSLVNRLKQQKNERKAKGKEKKQTVTIEEPKSRLIENEVIETENVDQTAASDNKENDNEQEIDDNSDEQNDQEENEEIENNAENEQQQDESNYNESEIVAEKDENREVVSEENVVQQSNEQIEESISIPVPSIQSRQSVIDDGRLMGVVIHGTDRLKTKLYISHPVVKVHLVDFETGQYLKKSNKNRAVSYNRDDQQVDYILPLMTKPCDFRRKKLASPVWDELLLFNELFNHLTRREIRAMIMFELLDYPSMVEVSASGDANDNVPADGWHKIAWAFLRIVSNSGSLNSGKRLRLQLFRAPKKAKNEGGSGAEVYNWWKNLSRIQYPGCLYVTIKNLASPGALPTATRSIVALQAEMPKNDIDPLGTQDENSQQDIQTAQMTKIKPNWSRVSGQPCKIPNKKQHELRNAKAGYFSAKFANDGITLAAAGNDESKFPIYLYEIPSGRLLRLLIGHLNVVYCLRWSEHSELLLSASADTTARLWNVSSGHCIQVLPHTTFVYSVLFHPNEINTFITGSFDKIIRFWRKTSGIEAELLHEINRHSSAVNCIELSPDKKRLLSGDSTGSIKIWSFEPLKKKRDFDDDEESDNKTPPPLTYVREIRNDEIAGNIVNCIHLMSDGRSLIVQTRDNCIRILDMRTGVSRYRLTGASVSSVHIRCTVTPCGRLLFSGSQDGIVTVWNVDRGERVAQFLPESQVSCKVIPCVDFHPFEHMIAFGSYGQNASLDIYSYDTNLPEMAKDFLTDTDEIKSKEKDRSYMEFSIKQLLEEHRLLTKLDSVEKLARAAAKAESLEETDMNELESLKPLKRKTTQVTFKDDEILAEPEIPHEKAAVEQTKATKEVAKALFDYEGQNGELSFRKGDSIEIVSKDDPNWWVGTIQNTTGYLPSNYVKIR